MASVPKHELDGRLANKVADAALSASLALSALDGGADPNANVAICCDAAIRDLMAIKQHLASMAEAA